MNPDWGKIGAIASIISIIISIVLTILGPLVAQWVKLHFPTKESFRISDEKFFKIYFGFLVLYDVYYVGQLLLSDSPITKWFIFQMCLGFTAFSVALTAYTVAWSTQRTRNINQTQNQIIETLKALSSSQTEAIGGHSEMISHLTKVIDFLISKEEDRNAPK